MALPSASEEEKIMTLNYVGWLRNVNFEACRCSLSMVKGFYRSTNKNVRDRPSRHRLSSGGGGGGGEEVEKN